MKLPDKALIGMLHLRALPGTPLNKLTVAEITETALSEAERLQAYGFSALLMENMHDLPYENRRVGEEITAATAVTARAIRKETSLPLGIQVLAGANKSAMAIAVAAELDFIRAEGFVFGHIADEGYMDADAAELMRYRRSLQAENVRIFCDIKKKHASHSVTGDINIVETALAAQFFLADGVIVSGSKTGKEPDVKELSALQEAVEIKILAGSGITAENLPKYWEAADGFIVGSYLKQGGLWSKELDEKRCRKLVTEYNRLKESRKK